MECFSPLAAISHAFAKHGPGLMPTEDTDKIEDHYLTYRSAYNRI